MHFDFLVFLFLKKIILGQKNMAGNPSQCWVKNYNLSLKIRNAPPLSSFEAKKNTPLLQKK